MASINSERDCRPLPPEIRQRCAIYLEEKTYTQAATLLTSLLVSNTSARRPIPAFTPSTPVLALFATVLVHPSTTTRPQNAEARTASAAAQRYLRTLLAQCSPMGSRLTQALTFTYQSHAQLWVNSKNLSRKKRSRTTTGSNTPRSEQSDSSSYEVDSESHDSEDYEVINNPLHGSAGLYNRAESFWSAVGWAFICSVHHKHRWAYWKHWLSFTLDVIDDDWNERIVSSRLCTNDDKERQRDPPNLAALNDSLGAQYLASAKANSNGDSSRTALSIILRAISATSSPQSIQEFPEIWRGETKRLKPVATSFKDGSKRKKLDLDEGEFGDYGDEVDDDEADDEFDDGEGAGAAQRDSSVAGRSGRKRNAKRKMAPGFTDFKNLDLDKGYDAGRDRSRAGIDTHAGAEEGSPSIKSSVDEYGGHESLALRLRLLDVVFRISLALEQQDNSSSSSSQSDSEIFATTADALRPLPPTILAFFLHLSPVPSKATSQNPHKPKPTSPSIATLPPKTLTTLSLHLLRTLSAAPLPPNFNTTTLPTLASLTTHLLPYAASSPSAADQARVAIALETLLRMCLRAEEINKSTSTSRGGAQQPAPKEQTQTQTQNQNQNQKALLHEAIRKGASARRAKVEKAKTNVKAWRGEGGGRDTTRRANEEAVKCLEGVEGGLRMLGASVVCEFD